LEWTVPDNKRVDNLFLIQGLRQPQPEPELLNGRSPVGGDISKVAEASNWKTETPVSTAGFKQLGKKKFKPFLESQAYEEALKRRGEQKVLARCALRAKRREASELLLKELKQCNCALYRQMREEEASIDQTYVRTKEENRRKSFEGTGFSTKK